MRGGRERVLAGRCRVSRWRLSRDRTRWYSWYVEGRSPLPFPSARQKSPTPRKLVPRGNGGDMRRIFCIQRYISQVSKNNRHDFTKAAYTSSTVSKARITCSTWGNRFWNCFTSPGSLTMQTRWVSVLINDKAVWLKLSRIQLHRISPTQWPPSPHLLYREEGNKTRFRIEERRVKQCEKRRNVRLEWLSRRSGQSRHNHHPQLRRRVFGI